ncbi:hypothetical protein Tcan_04737 [Toxocara canis]|uniref:Uncharacterized protein n=1 Tax=Toxocara canis TaxID=6265 RepID=A0A0B2UXR4_TOXCA|nr:hypothetical protein Tcan_04737 [Toxocara canis]
MNQPSSDLPPNFMAETAGDSDTRESERVHAPSKSIYDGLTPSSRNFMAETAGDSDTRESERVHAPSKSIYDGLTPSSRSHLPIQQPLAKQQLPAEDGFLKVFCRCGGNVEISSRDCHYCDRCVCYYHDSCLPLKEVDRFLLCFKCAPLQG